MPYLAEGQRGGATKNIEVVATMDARFSVMPEFLLGEYLLPGPFPFSIQILAPVRRASVHGPSQPFIKTAPIQAWRPSSAAATTRWSGSC